MAVRGIAWVALPLVSLACFPGCASRPPLDRARGEFYSGGTDRATTTLQAAHDEKEANRFLLDLERGTVLQASGDYETSARAYRDAADALERMPVLSVSQGAASMVANDTVLNYRGEPFERTLLHTFAAQSYLALGDWQSAAVEARQVIKSLSDDVRQRFPDDAYSRYVAGLCLELAGDPENAAVQYRRAAGLAPGVVLDETGRLAMPSNGCPGVAAPGIDDAELVCLVLAGSGSRYHGSGGLLGPVSGDVRGHVWIGTRFLGCSVPLGDVTELRTQTDAAKAVGEALKTGTRLGLKIGVAEAIERQHGEAAGALAYMLLIGLLEKPDLREWGTLPRSLQVLRVPCPPDLREFRVDFVNAAGVPVRTVLVQRPLVRKGRTIVALCRDIGHHSRTRLPPPR